MSTLTQKTLLKGHQTKRKERKPGPKVYFNTTFDPRLPHPRKIISRNYALLAKSEAAKKLFPRENLIASSKRLPNLGEMLSPTIQPQGRSKGDDQPRPPGGGGRGKGRRGGRGRGGNIDRGTRDSQPDNPSSRQGITQFPTVNGGPPTPLRGSHEEEEGLARRR